MNLLMTISGLFSSLGLPLMSKGSFLSYFPGLCI
jgi:hypothetical protein